MNNNDVKSNMNINTYVDDCDQTLCAMFSLRLNKFVAKVDLRSLYKVDASFATFDIVDVRETHFDYAFKTIVAANDEYIHKETGVEQYEDDKERTNTTASDIVTIGQ